MSFDAGTLTSFPWCSFLFIFSSRLSNSTLARRAYVTSIA